MFYESRGVGEPLVLIPGFASGAWSWSWQVDDLAKSFQIITFDPRGISRSRIGDDDVVSISGIAADIGALLDKLTIETAHVLGISFGGFVAQDFALRFPRRLKRLVLASTSFGGPNHASAKAREWFVTCPAHRSPRAVRSRSSSCQGSRAV